MIDFPCLSCGRRFSVPDDEAGRDVQCPACGNLVGVPSAADLAGLNPDGTLMVAAAVPRPDSARRFAELRRTFTPSTLDDDGNEIDNRTMADAIELATIPAADRSPPPARYDPETGELLTPFAVASPAPVPVLPAGPDAFIPGGRLNAYRANAPVVDVTARAVPPNRVWLELFRPLNVGVMAVVFVVHFPFTFSAFVVNKGFIVFFFAPLILFLLLIGHYGNVLDEIATTDADELPRPLRSLSWSDDLWGPARDVFAVLMLVAVPFLLMPHVVLAAVAAGGLLLLAPVLLLTLRTSGSLVNLSPERVVGTIRACGRDYLPVALLALVAVPALAAGFATTFCWFNVFVTGNSLFEWGVFETFTVSHLILLVGVYLAHLAAWRTGLMYRRHQPRFPWVDQEAIRGQPAARLRPVAPIAPAAAAPPLPPAARSPVQSGRRAPGGPAA